MCVCIFCIIMLEHLLIYREKKLVTFSISMYIMCVCLFSALSRRVGALQIAIIIIIKVIRPRYSGSVLQYFRSHQQMFCVLFYFLYATNALYLCVCALHARVVCCMCVLCACGCECLSVSIAVVCKL